MRNIRLAYLLSFLFESWFWYGIWVFYYLKFTNFGGIGLIESVAVITRTATEIPTGAVADLFGKKKTIIIAFIFSIIASLVFGAAQNIYYLIIGALLTAIGNSFFSGTVEAFIHDNLKAQNKENQFAQSISHLKSSRVMGRAFASVIGGFMYLLNPRLPFIAVGIAAIIGFVLTFFLQESQKIENKFVMGNFINQTKEGFKQLTKNPILKRQIIFYALIAFFITIMYEILDDALAVQFGFKPSQLGILWAVVCILVAITSQFTPFFIKKLGYGKGFFILTIIMAILLMVSPILGLILGGIFLIIRILCQVIYENMTMVYINENTESKYRATTISTYSMLENLPYVFMAFFIGRLIDVWSAKHFALIMGIIMLPIAFIFILKKSAKKLTASVDKVNAQ